MKILKMVFAALAVLVMSMSASFLVLAADSTNKSEEQAKELREDIKKLNEAEASSDNYESFYTDNKDWIEEINERVEEYMRSNLSNSNRFHSLSETDALETLNAEDLEEVQIVFKDLLIEPNSRQTRDTGLTNYFDWTTYSYRGGYWTYSMVPRGFTRSNRISCQLGWEDLKSYYPALQSNNTTNESLYWQYMCHYDAIIEYEWNIEVGRPNLPLGTMLLFFCNP